MVGECGDFLYWAFISYSHADRAWAEWLHRQLERYPIPAALVGSLNSRGEKIPARFKPVFRDRDELAAAYDLGEEIDAALRASRYLIVICSPKAARSPWVDKEVLRYKGLDRDECIRCLIVDGEPWASDRTDANERAAECFPPGIRHRLDKKGELSDLRSEPIAADARPHADGRDDAFLKLLAGLLGVKYDELKRRDEEYRRRQFRKTRFVAGAFAVIALAAVLLWAYALVKKNEAIQALTRADFEFGSEKIDAASAAEGAAYLARALHHDSGNGPAAQRLWSLLTQRTHWLPMAPPVRARGQLVHWEYSPDGKSLLVRDVLDGIRFIDTQTGREEGSRLKPAGWYFHAIHYLPGTNELLSFGNYSRANDRGDHIKHEAAFQRWDAGSRQSIGAPVATGLKSRFGRFAVDGASRLAAIWDDGGFEVALCDFGSGKAVGPVLKTKDRISHVLLAPGGKAVCVIEDRQRLQVYGTADGRPLGEPGVAGKDAQYEDLRIAGDKALVLLSGKSDGGQRVWQLIDSGAGHSVGSFPDPNYELTRGSLNATGNQLLAAGRDGRVHPVMMLGVGARLAEPALHRGLLQPVLRADGMQLATQFDHHTVVLRRVAPTLPGGRILLATRGAIDAVLGPDASRVLVRTGRNALSLYDAISGSQVGAAMEHSDMVSWFAFNSKGDQIFSVSVDGTARIWRASDAGSAAAPMEHDGVLLGPTVLNQDANLMLTTTNRNCVWLWRCNDAPKLVGRCQGPGRGLVPGMGFLSDGRTFWFARGRFVELWSVNPFARLREIEIDRVESIDAAAASRDGKHIAVAVGQNVRRLAVADGAMRAKDIGLPEKAQALLFHPDGKHLLVQVPNQLRTWALEDGREITTPIQALGIRGATFSADGTLLLATAGTKARLWDWRTARPVTDEIATTFTASFSANGRHLVFGHRYIVGIAATPPAGEAPDWLAPLAECVFHQRLGADGTMQTVGAEEWLAMRGQLAIMKGDAPWQRFGRWFAADPMKRPVFPDARDSTEDFLNRQLPQVRQIMEEERGARTE